MSWIKDSQHEDGSIKDNHQEIHNRHWSARTRRSSARDPQQLAREGTFAQGNMPVHEHSGISGTKIKKKPDPELRSFAADFINEYHQNTQALSGLRWTRKTTLNLD